MASMTQILTQTPTSMAMQTTTAASLSSATSSANAMTSAMSAISSASAITSNVMTAVSMVSSFVSGHSGLVVNPSALSTIYAMPTSDSNNNGSSDLSPGAIAGIAVGVVVFIALISLGTFFYCFLKLRRKNRLNNDIHTFQHADPHVRNRMSLLPFLSKLSTSSSPQDSVDQEKNFAVPATTAAVKENRLNATELPSPVPQMHQTRPYLNTNPQEVSPPNYSNISTPTQSTPQEVAGDTKYPPHPDLKPDPKNYPVQNQVFSPVSAISDDDGKDKFGRMDAKNLRVV